MVFVSGDVHYSCCLRLDYWRYDPARHRPHHPTHTAFVQVTASALKNQPGPTEVMLFQSGLVGRLTQLLGVPRERIGYTTTGRQPPLVPPPDAPFSRTVRAQNLSPLALFPVAALPPGTVQLYKPDFAWRLDIVRDGRPDAERLAGVTGVPPLPEPTTTGGALVRGVSSRHFWETVHVPARTATFPGQLRRPRRDGRRCGPHGRTVRRPAPAAAPRRGQGGPVHLVRRRAGRGRSRAGDRSPTPRAPGRRAAQMSHLDLPRAATHAYVGSIEELGRRLEPSVGADYCEACDVPTLAPPQSFFAKVAEAGTLLRQDEYLAATAKASEAVEILRELLSAEAETEERVELLVQRLALPALLDLLRRGEKWARADDPMSFTGKVFGGAYVVLVVLMMLDRRLAEWFPDAFAGHRGAALLGDTVQTWKDASDGGDADTAWPFYVVDTLGPLLAVLNGVIGLETERLQLWQGFGFDAADAVADTPARRLARRTPVAVVGAPPRLRRQGGQLRADPADDARLLPRRHAGPRRRGRGRPDHRAVRQR